MTNKDTSIETLKQQLQNQLASVVTLGDLEMLKNDWIGKEGTLKNKFKTLNTLPQEERAQFAAGLNNIKSELEEFIINKGKELQNSALGAKLKEEFIDLTLPGKT